MEIVLLGLLLLSVFGGEFQAGFGCHLEGPFLYRSYIDPISFLYFYIGTI